MSKTVPENSFVNSEISKDLFEQITNHDRQRYRYCKRQKKQNRQPEPGPKLGTKSESKSNLGLGLDSRPITSVSDREVTECGRTDGRVLNLGRIELRAPCLGGRLEPSTPAVDSRRPVPGQRGGLKGRGQRPAGNNRSGACFIIGNDIFIKKQDLKQRPHTQARARVTHAQTHTHTHTHALCDYCLMGSERGACLHLEPSASRTAKGRRHHINDDGLTSSIRRYASGDGIASTSRRYALVATDVALEGNRSPRRGYSRR
ncbi:hypothetical protein EVAR_17368_1 [Eumeta japonica]|uniref:Uncharacterized protein n=1 Tax=Eumeta variegata TaxID=151549 RepID=A0A4C1WIY1_EUMVA|nr:hypothetical protein EVAR_17368_1 [Eumeta japonica]